MTYPSGRTADPAPGLRCVVEGTTIYVPPDLFQAAAEAAVGGEPLKPEQITAKIFSVRLPQDTVVMAKAKQLGLAIVVDHYLPGRMPDAPLVET